MIGLSDQESGALLSSSFVMQAHDLQQQEHLLHQLDQQIASIQERMARADQPTQKSVEEEVAEAMQLDDDALMAKLLSMPKVGLPTMQILLAPMFTGTVPSEELSPAIRFDLPLDALPVDALPSALVLFCCARDIQEQRYRETRRRCCAVARQLFADELTQEAGLQSQADPAAQATFGGLRVAGIPRCNAAEGNPAEFREGDQPNADGA